MTTDAGLGNRSHFSIFCSRAFPTLVANQEEGNYLIDYHASSDTFDKVDIAQLKKHTAEAAWVTFALAEMPGQIGPAADGMPRSSRRCMRRIWTTS